MADIAISVKGLKEARAAIKAYPAETRKVIAQRMYRGGEKIMAKSKAEFVPVARGILRASGHVVPPVVVQNDIVVQMAFGGPAAKYALAVHENPRAGKTGGLSPKGKKYKHWSRVGQWKYLETPTKLLAPSVFQDVTNGVTAVMERKRGPTR